MVTKSLKLLLLCVLPITSAFTIPTTTTAHYHPHHDTTSSLITTRSTTFLSAKKASSKKKKSTSGTNSATRATRNKAGKRTASASGFGGAAVEDCPCGSNLGYMKCCGKIHKDASAYASATAEQVVRARYSAYAKREVDFIVGSTHPLNKNFMADIEHWKKTIKENCYDNFELTKCTIISESYETIQDGNTEKEIGKVCFVAEMTQVDSRENTSFMETSTFERAGQHIRGGAWLYKEGVIAEPPSDDDDDDDGGEEEEGEVKKDGVVEE